MLAPVGRVICVGNVMLDVTVSAEELAARTDVHGTVRVEPAGASANAAVWAGHAGAEATLIGRVGDDVAGGLLRAELAGRGVDLHLVVDADAPTGAVLAVHTGTERSMVADPGANARLSVEDLPSRLSADAVLLSGYVLFRPESEKAGLEALERADARWRAVDPAAYRLLEDHGVERFLRSVQPESGGANVILANEDEGRTLTGRDPEGAVRALAERFELACVRVDEGGAFLAHAGRVSSAGSRLVEVADPTGAGDAFNGVFLSHLAAGAEPEDALERAIESGARAAASWSRWPE